MPWLASRDFTLLCISHDAGYTVLNNCASDQLIFIETGKRPGGDERDWNGIHGLRLFRSLPFLPLLSFPPFPAQERKGETQPQPGEWWGTGTLELLKYYLHICKISHQEGRSLLSRPARQGGWRQTESQQPEQELATIFHRRPSQSSAGRLLLKERELEMKRAEWIVKTRNPKVRDRWSSQHRKVGVRVVREKRGKRGKEAGAESTAGACPRLARRCIAHTCTERWVDAAKAPGPPGPWGGRREQGKEGWVEEEKLDQRNPAGSISWQALPCALCSRPEGGRSVGGAWGGSRARAHLFSRAEASSTKSIMRLKDHFVTLIFLLRRQIFYSTSFFLFLFCKNGIHEPIQNANGNMWIWSFLHRNIVHVHLKNRTGLKGKIRRRCD